MQRRAVKTKHAPCRRPVRRVCRTGPLSTYCNATQQRNRARAQAASVVKKAAAAINTIGVWSGVVCRRSSSRSRRCSGNGVQRESVTGGRSFMIQTWPGPPSRRACVSSTRECGTSSAPIPSMPARRTAFSCQVVNNKTKTKPHGGGKEKDRPHHHDVPWLRARLALPWRRSKHPRTRAAPAAISTSNNGSRSNQGFRGTGLGRRCSILQASFERRQIFPLLTHHVSLTDQQSHGHPAGTCPWQNNALPANPAPVTTDQRQTLPPCLESASMGRTWGPS